MHYQVEFSCIEMKLKFNIEFFTKWGEELYVELDRSYLLEYGGNGIWSGEIRINDEKERRIIEYRYFVKNSNGEIFYEAGKKRVIAINSSTSAIEAFDCWCPNSNLAPLLTAPFSDVLYKNNSSQYTYTHKSNYEIIIRVIAPKIGLGSRLLLCGATAELGEWDPSKAKEMKRVNGERWEYSMDGSNAASTEFKFILATKGPKEESYQWESGGNREIPLSNNERHKSIILEQGILSFPTPLPKIAGCAVPLFSLRSRRSCGVGDFADLKLLIDWAAQSGERIIQLLPINDTSSTNGWEDSYPYNCISVFALHPIYINLDEIGELQQSNALKEFRREKRRVNNDFFLNYPEVWNLKMEYCRAIYRERGEETFAEPLFYTFVKENEEWLYPYAAFCTLREHYKEPNFRKWEEHYSFSEDIIELLRNNNHPLNKEFNFHIYLQYLLHKQLLECKEYAHKKGVALKGDIPIGVSRNGADSWQNPQYFNFEQQAGAPPDAFSEEGQNWGFPTYNWERMAADNYSWWKKRLIHMQEYFDAYRIDHILGFFRIWEIPLGEKDSRYGHFHPALPLSVEEIRAAGVPLNKELFVEDPYRKGSYHPAILPQKSSEFTRLSDYFFYERHNEFWYANAVKKLEQLIAATNMLVCGEDLGMLAESVTRCLKNLNILSLEVMMMPKNPGTDLGEPEKYPYLSICTSSTHDSETLRMWLGKRVCKEEPKDAPASECLKIVKRLLGAGSMAVILPIQDWFSIDEKHRNRYFESERINDPSNPHNLWRYRIDICLEDLIEDKAFSNKIKRLIKESGRE